MVDISDIVKNSKFWRQCKCIIIIIIIIPNINTD